MNCWLAKLGLSGLVLLAACTSINKATFAIEPQEPVASDEMLRGVEECFRTLGVELQRKIDFLYPETRKETTYFLGHRELPLALQSTYRHAVLRLEHSGILYVDWVEFTDLRRELKPELFAPLQQRSLPSSRLDSGSTWSFISSHRPRHKQHSLKPEPPIEPTCLCALSGSWTEHICDPSLSRPSSCWPSRITFSNALAFCRRASPAS